MKCYSLGHNLKAHLKSHRDSDVKSRQISNDDSYHGDKQHINSGGSKHSDSVHDKQKYDINAKHTKLPMDGYDRKNGNNAKNTKLPMPAKPGVQQNLPPSNVNNVRVVESEGAHTVLHVKYITPRSAGNRRSGGNSPQTGGIQAARLEQVQPSGSEVQTSSSSELHPIVEKPGISDSETQRVQNNQTTEFGKNHFPDGPAHQDQIADKLTPPSSMLRMLPPPPPLGPPGVPSSLPPPPVGPPVVLPPPPPSGPPGAPSSQMYPPSLGALTSQMYPMTTPHSVTSSHSMTSPHPMTSLHSMTPQLQLLTPVNTDDLPPSQHQPMELVVSQEGQPPIEIPVVSANEQVPSSGQLTAASANQIAYL